MNEMSLERRVKLLEDMVVRLLINNGRINKRINHIDLDLASVEVFLENRLEYHSDDDG